MIILRLKGGLGNQLFQYAAGRALAERHGVPLHLDVRWYDADAVMQSSTKRTFDLPHFAVQCVQATTAELRSCFASDDRSLRARVGRNWPSGLVSRRIWTRDEPGYDPEFARLPANVFIEGYFQHPAYFVSIAENLRHEFRLCQALPSAVVDFAAELSATASVCIQVRRSDYVSNPSAMQVHGACSEVYYRAAWDRMAEQVPEARGYVFSDDQAWAERVFARRPKITVVGPEWNGPAYLYKFHLMCACRHFIIANSTWGWWAAWLGTGQGKVVVIPDRWYRDASLNIAAMGLRLPGWICAT